MGDPRYDTFMGHGPRQIVHWEHWSCPDGETYLTGIDYFDHPKLCRERMAELYPQLGLPIPEDDTPKARPTIGTDKAGEVKKDADKDGEHRSRWGETETKSWGFGKTFHTAKDVFA
ncbi:MAG: hypothetical protein HQL31_10795, partial [Planctomycetes bacterium]|nr:hypothetical protein [Planctomycetota bacterium]